MPRSLSAASAVNSRRGLRAAACAAMLLAAVPGCAVVSTPDGNYVAPIGGAVVTDNETLYSQPLRCVGGMARDRAGASMHRIAVGQVNDLTGKSDYYTGKPVTQGAALMVISAFSKAGVDLVERFDTSVTELELKYANNKLIGDDEQDFRKILAGSIIGSDYYVVGGVTELNFNIRSGSADMTLGPVSASARYYVLNVGIDLRLVNTRNLKVAHVVSLQKQIIGRELRAGLFEFIGKEVLDLSAGERSQEPIHAAVRAVAERAVLELIGRLYEVNTSACQPERGDPLAPGETRATHNS